MSLTSADLTLLAILTAAFSGGLVISGVLATKVIAIGSLSVPAGVLGFSLTFLCTDVVNELYGPKHAYRIVTAGLITLILVLVLIAIAIVWPPAPFWDEQAAFESVLQQSWRVIAAGIGAYIVSQRVDVWIFSRIRAASGERYLWLRNNASTVTAQLLDSAVFVTIAFAGQMPVFPLIFGQWIVKLAIAALDTPLVYAGVLGFKRLRTPQKAAAYE